MTIDTDKIRPPKKKQKSIMEQHSKSFDYHKKDSIGEILCSL